MTRKVQRAKFVDIALHPSKLSVDIKSIMSLTLVLLFFCPDIFL